MQNPGYVVRNADCHAKNIALYYTRLGIAPRNYADMLERLCESAVEVGAEVIEAARNESHWRPIAKQMVHAWNEGMASLRDPKKSVLAGRVLPRSSYSQKACLTCAFRAQCDHPRV